MTAKVYCPHADCGQRYRVDETQLGQATVCKRCRRQFTLSLSADQTQAPAGESDTPGGQFAAAPEQPADDSPKCLGRFQIRSRIGVGGFGTVYRAYDPVLEREVALKVPRAEVLQEPKARARFLREPKAAAQLRHPHIVPIYDAGSDGDHYYIASAYIEGQTLKDAIEDQQPDFRRLAQIVRDLAEALDYAHGMGVIHRDVKPANVMIDTRGQALLMDFGLAHLESSGEKLTQDGSVMGTPAYMAPEQADSSFGEIGSASDQYGLGVVLYELLSGQIPFSGPAAAVIFNHLHQTPESPRHINPQVPRDLETICLKAMAKWPNDRYAGCAALAEDLRRWLDGEPVHARQMRVAERLVRWCRRNPVVATLSATTAILLVVVAVVTSVSAVRTSGALAVAEVERSRAEQERGRAEQERGRAEAGLFEAQRQRKLVEQSAAEAQRQQQRAEEARRDAETRLAELEQQKKETERERQTAVNAGRTAQTERSRAQEASRDATSARRQAENNLAEAERQRGRVEERERLMRLHLYASEMNHAMQALEEKDFDRVERILEGHLPKSSEDEDLRSFEWHYLANQCGFHGRARAHEPAISLQHGSPVHRVEVAHDGSAFAAIGADGVPRSWEAVTFRFCTPQQPPPAAFQTAYLAGLRQREQEVGTPLSALGWDGCLPYAWSPACEMRALAESPTPPNRYLFGGRELVQMRRGQGPPSALNQPVAVGEPVDIRSEYPPCRQVVLDAADSRGKLAAQADYSEPLAFSVDGTRLALTKWTFRQWRESLMWRSPINGFPMWQPLNNGLLPALPYMPYKEMKQMKQYLCCRTEAEIWDITKKAKVASYDISWSEPVFSLLPAGTGSGLAIIEPPNHLSFEPNGQISPPHKRDAKTFRFKGRVSVLSLNRPRLQLSLFPDFIAFNSDGNVFVGYASSSRVAEIVDLKMGRTRRVEKLQGDRVTISPDGTVLAAWYEAAAEAVKKPRPLSGTMAEAKGRLHKELDLHSNTIVELRDVADGRVRALLQGHKYAVRAVAFSSDGKSVATGSDDASIKLWDVVTGLEKCTLKGHADGVLCLAFNNDGTALVSGSRDGTMRIWQASP